MFKKGISLLILSLIPLMAHTQGTPQSPLKLGYVHSKGAASSPDYVKAVQYYTLAAEQNDPTAQFALALCYQLGLGVVKDYTSALYWYHQAVSHRLPGGIPIPAHQLRKQESTPSLAWVGNEEYQVALAVKDPANTKQPNIQWLKSAAQKGNPQAQFQLALSYLTGNNLSQDDTKALFWLNKAADKNHQAAQGYLAWANLLGLGTKADVEEAVKWFLRARQTQQTTQVAVPESKVSEEPLSKEANMEQFRHGVALFEGTFEENEIAKGLKMIEQAAQQDLGSAQYYLAKLYDEGRKVTRNPALAAKWYKKCALNGNTAAQIALGWLHYNGEGMPQDKLAAYRWFNKASFAGDQQATSAKAFVAAQLSTNEQAKLGILTKTAKK